MKSILCCIFLLSVVNAQQRDIRTRRHITNPLECFDDFGPVMTNLANKTKEAAEVCLSHTANQKELELAAMESSRSDLYSEIVRVKETLSNCSAQSDFHSYFRCIQTIINLDRKIVGEITAKTDNYTNKIKEIEANQHKCFRNLISKVKEKAFNAINALQSCLTTGESPAPQQVRNTRSSRSRTRSSPNKNRTYSIHID